MVVIGAREPVSNPVSGGYSIYARSFLCPGKIIYKCLKLEKQPIKHQVNYIPTILYCARLFLRANFAKSLSDPPPPPPLAGRAPGHGTQLRSLG